MVMLGRLSFYSILIISNMTACSSQVSRTHNENTEKMENIFEDSEEIATESMSYLNESEIENLIKRAEQGDIDAMKVLSNHYGIMGPDDPKNFEIEIYWIFQQARAGDCDSWRELMYREIKENSLDSKKYLKSNENLEQIGERSNCGQYERLKN